MQVNAGSAQFCAYTEGVRWTRETIRRSREMRGWSQREAAEALAAAQGSTKNKLRAYQAWEAGTATPSGRNLAALDIVFGQSEAPAPPSEPSLTRATDLELIGELLRRLSARPRPEAAPPPGHDPADPGSHDGLVYGPPLPQPGERARSDG